MSISFFPQKRKVKNSDLWIRVQLAKGNSARLVLKFLQRTILLMQAFSTIAEIRNVQRYGYSSLLSNIKPVSQIHTMQDVKSQHC